jgi:hypothetical protein
MRPFRCGLDELGELVVETPAREKDEEGFAVTIRYPGRRQVVYVPRVQAARLHEWLTEALKEKS